MARAGFYQARIVAQNIIASIKGRSLTPYKPDVAIEASIKLTLGKVSVNGSPMAYLMLTIL